MSTSIQQQILDAITDAVSGTYGTDMPDDTRDLPITLVSEDAEEATSQYGVSSVSMPVVVARAESMTGKTEKQWRDQALAIKTALMQEMFDDSTFGGLADGLDYTAGGIAAEPAGGWVGAELNFTVRFHHVLGDPTTQDET